MKRAIGTVQTVPAKRLCVGASYAVLNGQSSAECSSSTRPEQALMQQQQQQQQHVCSPQLNQALPLKSPATTVLEQLLERTLTEADQALNLTLNAMSVATKICAHGSGEAADKALNIAEQALAATVQQLARAQALVQRKVQQQQLYQAAVALQEEDEELQDTCSSAPSSHSSAQQLSFVQVRNAVMLPATRWSGSL